MLATAERTYIQVLQDSDYFPDQDASPAAHAL